MQKTEDFFEVSIETTGLSSSLWLAVVVAVCNCFGSLAFLDAGGQ